VVSKHEDSHLDGPVEDEADAVVDDQKAMALSLPTMRASFAGFNGRTSGCSERSAQGFVHKNNADSGMDNSK
jgi:hypothetical protein